MRKRLIGISTVNIDPQTRKNVLKVLLSNRLSYGDFTARFERRMASLHNRRYAIFCNSGTSALHVALGVLKEKHLWADGDEVLVPAVTFVATANVVFHNRLRPVFVDVESDYFGINPKKIKERITKKTKAIIPVHLFGQSADMDPIMKITHKYHLKVVEDSAEAMFVGYKGKPVGSWGDIACFSTYATHLITTGVGGFAMTNDDELAIMLKSFFNHSRDNTYLSIDDDDMKQTKKFLEVVQRRFSFIHLGHSFRLTEMEAVIGLGQLAQWREIIAKRQENAAYLSRGLSTWSQYLRLPMIRPGATHAFMLYPLLVIDKKIQRNKLINFLEINGIETRYLMPLINQPVYRKIFGDIEKKYPVAQMINQNGFIIGCHQDLNKRDLDYIIETFDRFLKKIH